MLESRQQCQQRQNQLIFVQCSNYEMFHLSTIILLSETKSSPLKENFQSLPKRMLYH